MSLPIAIQNSSLIRKTAQLIFRIIGWRSSIIQPAFPSYVFIGAPHTSNWDFAIFMLLITAEKIPVHWLGKDSLFKGPFGFIIKALGGIPVNRNTSTKFVDQVADMFLKEKDLIIAMAPEGTRSITSRWRSGFYYIAMKANIPIALAFIDYKRKICGLGPSFIPTGNINEDFKIIQDFYKGYTGKFPEKQGEIRLSEE